MHAVRKHILEILKERQNATVSELAEALEMAPVSVRHHLDLLQADNLIAVDRYERKGNVGRPQQVYALTGEADGYFPNNFAILARNLVRQVKNVLPQEQIDTLFKSLAVDLAAEFGADGPIDPEQCTREHVRRVAEFLNARGYLASYEEAETGVGSDVLLLHKHNCPYAGVSGEHSELCLMDQKLVDTLMGSSCERVAHMVNEGHCCTYRIEVPHSADFMQDAIPLTVRMPERMRATEVNAVALAR